MNSSSSVNNQSVLAWHFSNGEMRFEYEGKKIYTGLILKIVEDPIPEQRGFHACESPFHALQMFAVRPNPDIVISRVRLSGTIIEDKATAVGDVCQRYTAQCREHLWVAQARMSLEEFAQHLIFQILEKLMSEGIDIPDILLRALKLRFDWKKGDVSTEEITRMSEELKLYGKDYSSIHGFDFEHLPIENKYSADYVTTLGWYRPKHLNAQDWYEYWKLCEQGLPKFIANCLSAMIVRDTQFFALEAQTLAMICHHVICNFYGWTQTLQDSSSLVVEHVEDFSIRMDFGVALGPYRLEAPAKYLDDCDFQLPDPNETLHKRLMQLAPSNYYEI